MRSFRTGGAASVDSINGVGELRSVTSAANSKITYSFDGDWGNDPYWAATRASRL